MCKKDENLKWDEISREELKVLSYDQNWSDSMIAKQFCVSISRVRYKRKKLRLTRADIMYEQYIGGNYEILNDFNQKSFNWFLNECNIDLLAKSITNYIFRKGTVENLHSSKKLTQSDMKTLNVFMVNQIAGLLLCVLNNEWMRLRKYLRNTVILSANGWK